MTTSRETIRDALVTLLTTALVGTGLPVKTVSGSKVDTLAGVTPLVAVLSAGTHRKRITYQGTIPTFYLEIQVWVRQATTGWTNAQAEDALDEIEALIASVFADEVATANWSLLEYSDRSTVLELTVAGLAYYMECIPVTVNTTKA